MKGNRLMTVFWAFFSAQGYNNSKGVTLEASFTPDSQFVMIGKKRFSFCLGFAQFSQFCNKRMLAGNWPWRTRAGC